MIRSEHRWIWVAMPEKKYLGYATVGPRGFEISMMDPIPNKLCDECYGEYNNEKTIERGVAFFVLGMLKDRERFVGKNWRPSRETLSRLWKGRKDRKIEIEENIRRYHQ